MGARRFVGGLNVPLDGMRADATWPFGVLTVSEGKLSLTSRIVFRFRTEMAIDDVLAFPLAARFLRPGVGIELADGQTLYFWTFAKKREAVLAASASSKVALTQRPGRRRSGSGFETRPSSGIGRRAYVAIARFGSEGQWAREGY